MWVKFFENKINMKKNRYSNVSVKVSRILDKLIILIWRHSGHFGEKIPVSLNKCFVLTTNGKIFLKNTVEMWKLHAVFVLIVFVLI